MRRALSIGVSLVLAGFLAVSSPAVRADSGPDLNLDQVNVRYRGGPLLGHVRVSTLFWGPYWQGNRLADYLNGFFPALFSDGRYLANLAQYSAAGTRIENGEFVATATDGASPPSRVTDEQIQEEIRAQVAAGGLPRPLPDTLYVVFMPPRVVVEDPSGEESDGRFAGYHFYHFDGRGGGFAYAVILYDDKHPVSPGDARLMTDTVSHELAEAVTDPQPLGHLLGWYDDQNGEIGDIPQFLYFAGRIGPRDLWDVLEATDGKRYLVQKVWSVRDAAPVAFAAAVPVAAEAGPAAGSAVAGSVPAPS